jgi:hypothetical protein
MTAIERLIERYRSVNGHLASDGYEDRDEDEIVTAALAQLTTTTAERDAAQALAKRLADDALVALAGSKIATPEEGFLKAPHCLPDCIERLRAERDRLRKELDEIYEASRAMADLMNVMKAAFDRVNARKQETNDGSKIS